jgi:hypothetical protein
MHFSITYKYGSMTWQYTYEFNEISLEGNPLAPTLVTVIKQGEQAVNDFFQQK